MSLSWKSPLHNFWRSLCFSIHALLPVKQCQRLDKFDICFFKLILTILPGARYLHFIPCDENFGTKWRHPTTNLLKNWTWCTSKRCCSPTWCHQMSWSKEMRFRHLWRGLSYQWIARVRRGGRSAKLMRSLPIFEVKSHNLKSTPGCSPIKLQNGDVVLKSLVLPVLVNLHGSNFERFIRCLSFLTIQN